MDIILYILLYINNAPRVWSRIAPEQDQDRLLPGHQPTGSTFRCAIHLSGIHFSAAQSRGQVSEGLCEFFPGSQSRCSQSDAADHP